MSLIPYESERFVVACVVSRPESMAAAVTMGLEPAHFATPEHETVFAAALDLFRRDLLESANVVRAELQAQGAFGRAGGDAGWADLLGNYGWEEAELPYHVRRVSEAFRLREQRAAMDAALASLTDAAAPLADKQRAVDAATTRLLELSAAEDSTLERAEDMARTFRALFEGDEPQAVYSPTGFPSLDSQVGGLPIGRITTVAAFTSQGKSAFTDQLMLHHARRWKQRGERLQAIKFSPEVPNADSRLRVIANLAEVDARAIERHMQERERLPVPQAERVRKALDVLGGLPVVWDDRSAPTTAYMRARLLAEHARCPVGLAVFDYLEMTGEQHKEKRIRLEQALLGCHDIARDLGIPFVVVAQINRSGHGRPDGVPHLSDLAESSMIEKISSLVLMLHHPHTHWSQTDRAGEEPNQLHYNVLVRKNTRGPLGAVTSISWRKACLRFYDEQDPETRAPLGTLTGRSGDGHTGRPPVPAPDALADYGDDAPF